MQKIHSNHANLSSNPIRRKEEKDFILELKGRNEALLLDQKRLQSRLKSATISIKKYKLELESLSRRRRGATYAAEQSKLSSSGCRLSVLHSGSEGCNDTADTKELEKASKEIAQLKNELDYAHTQIKILSSHPLHSTSNLGEDNFNNSTLESDYRALVVASNEQIQLQEEMRKKLDACNTYIRNLQGKIQELETAEMLHQSKTEMMEELFQENKMLHEKISKLCLLPFLEPSESIPYTKTDIHTEDIEHLESKVTEYSEQVNILSMNNRALREGMQEMEVRLHDLLHERDLLVVELEQAREEAIVQRQNDMLRSIRSDGMTQTELESLLTDTEIEPGSQSSDIRKLRSIINELRLVERFQYEKIKLLQRSDAIVLSNNPMAFLEPDETILELTVKSAALINLDKHSDSRTFAIVDFLDFESQTSKVVLGWYPEYNFTRSFKLKLSSFLLRQMERNNAWVEVYTVRNQVISLYGRSDMGIKDLLTSREYKKQLVLLSQHGQDVGYILVHFNLFQSMPILA